jgi:hypothetical protein
MSIKEIILVKENDKTILMFGDWIDISEVIEELKKSNISTKVIIEYIVTNGYEENIIVLFFINNYIKTGAVYPGVTSQSNMQQSLKKYPEHEPKSNPLLLKDKVQHITEPLHK